jgi:hypothetical protein
MVAVPPDEEEDALVDAPLVAGVTTMNDIVSAPAARAAYADRFSNPFNPIALPLLVGRPGDDRFAPAPTALSRACAPLNSGRQKIG